MLQRMLAIAKRDGKKLLAFIGVATVFDVVKEYGRARVMDFAVDHLGGFGRWLVANPVALLTLATGFVLALLMVSAMGESLAQETDSSILDHAERKFPKPRITKRWTAGFVGVSLVLLVAIGYGMYRYLNPAPAPRHPPAAPTLTGAITSVEVPFEDSEKPVAISKAITPCDSRVGKTYSYNDFSKIPGGSNFKRPWLLPKPERFIIRRNWVGDNKDVTNLLLQVSVVSRGETSVAKDWRLCLVHDNKPFRFRAEEITPENRSVLNGGTSLADFSLNPIEHGHMATGWLLFRVPTDVVGDKFNGSIGCRDYLEYQYSISFGTPEK